MIFMPAIAVLFYEFCYCINITYSLSCHGDIIIVKVETDDFQYFYVFQHDAEQASVHWDAHKNASTLL